MIATSPGAVVYPVTLVHPVVDHYFRHTVTDPYRWLENPASPTVKAWAARQSALALGFLQSEPSYPIYPKRVAALSRTSTQRFGLQIADGRS